MISFRYQLLYELALGTPVPFSEMTSNKNERQIPREWNARYEKCDIHSRLPKQRNAA